MTPDELISVTLRENTFPDGAPDFLACIRILAVRVVALERDARTGVPRRACLVNRDVMIEALRLLREFDAVRTDEMTPLFYAHGYAELSLALRDILRSADFDVD